MARAATSSPISWEIPAAGFLHVLMGLLALLTQCEREHEPLFKADEVMVVEMAGPPRTTTRMPQKAERAPDPSAKSSGAVPPPPNPSDMAFRTPDAPKSDGAADTRQALIDKLRREQMIKDLSAPEGSVDRAQTSPEGSEEAGDVASAGLSDPALQRWIKAVQAAVTPNWHPLIQTCRASPDLAVFIRVEIDDAGAQTDAPTISKSSGNRSLDESARRAVEITGSLPPLPDRYKGHPLSVKFECLMVL